MVGVAKSGVRVGGGTGVGGSDVGDSSNSGRILTAGVAVVPVRVVVPTGVVGGMLVEEGTAISGVMVGVFVDAGVGGTMVLVGVLDDTLVAATPAEFLMPGTLVVVAVSDAPRG